MARRSRRRARRSAHGERPRAPERGANERPASGRVPARAERPKPPWHPVPLVELSVLAGIVLLALGFFRADTETGRVMLVCGMLLGSLGGLDTVLREHFAAYRSHSAVLAGVPAVALAAALYFAGAPWPAVVLAPAAVFWLAATALARAYRRRAG